MDVDAIIAKVDSQLAATSKPDSTQDTPVAVQEKAPEATTTEAAAPEQPATPPVKETKDAPVDWWDTKNDTPEVQERIKSIQREYNKKAELASRVEKEALTARAQLEETARAVKEALMDPTKYQEWRRTLGFKDEVTEAKADLGNPKISLQGVTTPEELEGAFNKALEERDRYWENRLQNTVSNASRVQAEKVAEISQPIAREKWESAVSKMKEEYGDKWAGVEAEVVNLVANGPYRDMYLRKLVDEKGVLDKAFKAEFSDLYVEHTLEKRSKINKTKSASVTETPKKSATKSLPSDNSPDSIIARVNARVPRT